MSVSVVTVLALLNELTRRGVAWEDMLRASEVDLSDLSDARNRLPIQPFLSLVERAFEKTGDLSLGLHVGLNAPISSLRVVGPIILASGTLREAVDSLIRYSSLLVAEARWDLQEEGTTAQLRYKPPSKHATLARFCAEYAFSLAARVAQELTSSPYVERTEVRFVHAPPPDVLMYQRVFGCPVRFSQQENALIFPRERLDSAHLHRDAATFSALAKAAELLLRASQGAGVSDRVRSLLRDQDDLTHVDAGFVASRFSMSPRTLRRRLTHEGTSASLLLDEVRCERARDELASRETSLKGLAAQLGFSSTATFHRAFKRWTGLTPSEYARKKRN